MTSSKPFRLFALLAFAGLTPILFAQTTASAPKPVVPPPPFPGFLNRLLKKSVTV